MEMQSAQAGYKNRRFVDCLTAKINFSKCIIPIKFDEQFMENPKIIKNFPGLMYIGTDILQEADHCYKLPQFPTFQRLFRMFPSWNSPMLLSKSQCHLCCLKNLETFFQKNKIILLLETGAQDVLDIDENEVALSYSQFRIQIKNAVGSMEV
jgi:hypothetical protein